MTQVLFLFFSVVPAIQKYTGQRSAHQTNILLPIVKVLIIVHGKLAYHKFRRKTFTGKSLLNIFTRGNREQSWMDKPWGKNGDFPQQNIFTWFTHPGLIRHNENLKKKRKLI